jgi:hypothetical protein
MAEKTATSEDSLTKAPQPAVVPITQPSGPHTVLDGFRLIWDFTESNFSTFVIPNTSFGVLGALAGAALIEESATPVLEILQRLPLVVLLNWYSVLIFDLVNQRSPESIQEDIENQPWRPLPSGKVTVEQTWRAMLIAIPTVLACNYSIGAWEEGVFILILTWLYNDLGGGDDLVRPRHRRGIRILPLGVLADRCGPDHRRQRAGCAVDRYRQLHHLNYDASSKPQGPGRRPTSSPQDHPARPGRRRFSTSCR